MRWSKIRKQADRSYHLIIPEGSVHSKRTSWVTLKCAVWQIKCYEYRWVADGAFKNGCGFICTMHCLLISAPNQARKLMQKAYCANVTFRLPRRADKRVRYEYCNGMLIIQQKIASKLLSNESCSADNRHIELKLLNMTNIVWINRLSIALSVISLCSSQWARLFKVVTCNGTWSVHSM